MTDIDFRSLLGAGAVEASRAPTALTGRELQDLVSPLSTQAFVDSYFSRTSVSVKGHPHKFDHIFGWERLRQAIARGKSLSGTSYNIKAAFTHGEEVGDAQRMLDAEPGQIGELLDKGATICITDIHLADPVLAQWAQAVRAQLNFTGLVGVNCYVSPDGSGLPTHYDKRVATSIQISGKKYWRYSLESAKPWPLENAVYQPASDGAIDPAIGTSPAKMAFGEVVLEAGDLLCLPAGAWHAARGIGHSLALNVYFSPQNFIHQLAPLIQHLAVQSGSWRGGPPATLEKVQGDMPTAVTDYMRQRFDEVCEIAAEAWLSSLAQEPYKGWKPEPLLPLPGIAPDQRFRIAATLLRYVRSDEGLLVACDNGMLRFPDTMAPIFQRLSAEEAGFTIPDVLSWQTSADGPSREQILQALKTLFSNGLMKLAQEQ